MAATQKFRTAFNGFNRKDVVDYIEYMNNRHNSEIEQLNNQLQIALSKTGDGGLQLRLEAAEARIRELESEAANAVVAEAVPENVHTTEKELEAYRRAERAERQANERAKQIYEQANAVLAEASLKAESASQRIGTIADQVVEQLQEYQKSMLDTKATFQEAVSTLYAIRPDGE